MIMKVTPAGDKLDVSFEMFEKTLDSIPSILFDEAQIRRLFRDAMINKKYKFLNMKGKPSDILDNYIKMATKGDKSYLNQSFYRELRKNRDPVVKKLEYRLQRSNKV